MGRGGKVPCCSETTRYLTERVWQYSRSRRIISDKCRPTACLNLVVKRIKSVRIASLTRSSKQRTN